MVWKYSWIKTDGILIKLIKKGFEYMMIK